MSKINFQVHFGHGFVIPALQYGYSNFLFMLDATRNPMMFILFANFYYHANIVGKKTKGTLHRQQSNRNGIHRFVFTIELATE